MKTASAKAKGRRLQKQVCADLFEIGKNFGLESDDITSRSMGCNGVDVILTPAARRLFNLSTECKNVESLNVVATFLEHFEKYKNDESLKLLVHARNKLPKEIGPLVTLRWMDLLTLLGMIVTHEQNTGRKIGFKAKR